MIRKGSFFFSSIFTPLLITFLTSEFSHARKSKEQIEAEAKQKKEREEKQKLYDDPNQPEVVRKTRRHPDADKLETDYD